MQHSGSVQAARVGVFTSHAGPPMISCDRCGRQREQNTRRGRPKGPSVCKDCRQSDPEYLRLISQSVG